MEPAAVFTDRVKWAFDHSFAQKNSCTGMCVPYCFQTQTQLCSFALRWSVLPSPSVTLCVPPETQNSSSRQHFTSWQLKGSFTEDILCAGHCGKENAYPILLAIQCCTKGTRSKRLQDPSFAVQKVEACRKLNKFAEVTQLAREELEFHPNLPDIKTLGLNHQANCSHRPCLHGWQQPALCLGGGSAWWSALIEDHLALYLFHNLSSQDLDWHIYSGGAQDLLSSSSTL